MSGEQKASLELAETVEAMRRLAEGAARAAAACEALARRLQNAQAGVARLLELLAAAEQAKDYLLSERWRLDPELIAILEDTERPSDEVLDSIVKGLGQIDREERGWHGA